MNSLFVLYDSRCGVCTQLKGWLLRQPAYVTLHFIALGSAEARARFPMLGAAAQELAVIADTGEGWLGDRAWITCLWALREYRGWAQKLSTPAMLPLARQAFLALSGNRFALSRLLGLRSEEDVKRYLTETPVPPCQIQP
jgi:predicted DCC family thiol-disulfide oxidoreductase YuxK